MILVDNDSTKRPANVSGSNLPIHIACYLGAELTPRRRHDRRLGAGQITFPCGTPDTEDISGRSVDLMGHMRREIIEETGLNPDEFGCESCWSFVCDRNYLALLKRFSSSETAEVVRTRIKRASR